MRLLKPWSALPQASFYLFLTILTVEIQNSTASRDTYAGDDGYDGDDDAGEGRHVPSDGNDDAGVTAERSPLEDNGLRQMIANGLLVGAALSR